MNAPQQVDGPVGFQADGTLKMLRMNNSDLERVDEGVVATLRRPGAVVELEDENGTRLRIVGAATGVGSVDVPLGAADVHPSTG